MLVAVREDGCRGRSGIAGFEGQMKWAETMP